MSPLISPSIFTSTYPLHLSLVCSHPSPLICCSVFYLFFPSTYFFLSSLVFGFSISNLLLLYYSFGPQLSCLQWTTPSFFILFISPHLNSTHCLAACLLFTVFSSALSSVFCFLSFTPLHPFFESSHQFC